MAYHTYEFLRRRKNEPKWREAYQKALLLRMIGIVCMLAIIAVGLFVYKYDIDIMHYVNLVADKAKEFIQNFKDNN
ncbi:MAG: hypothetical protein L0I48_08895 [Lactococcus plantarum]|nr:hypothetical protein [Lactococcus plantarum]